MFNIKFFPKNWLYCDWKSLVTTVNNHPFACYIKIRAYSQIASQPAIICSKLIIKTQEQRDEICSKLTIKTPKRRHWRRFHVFIVNFEHISHLCSSVSIVNFEQVNPGLVEDVLEEEKLLHWRHLEDVSKIYAKNVSILKMPSWRPTASH